jgi:hypothetical protein
MLTNDSIDVFMLQKLQSKQARYLEAMKKGADVLDVSDISTQELKTAIITNPETRANIEIELMKKRIESEKNKHLADIAFVLRKHQDFLKVQEEVTKAQNNYNRILAYSKEEGDNAEYWRNQLPFYQKSINLAKEKVQEEIEHLLQKGVNVTEIENKKLVTENKIEELDKKLDDLPNVREELVSKYREEKEMQLKSNDNRDYVGDRKVENSELFRGSKSERIEKKININPEDEQKYYVLKR